MPKSITSYDYRNDLYKTYLSIINNTKFTFREVDIIACIIHNRGEKKVATICNISHTTVSTHVHNIMVKLGYNSKDQIIDFVEKSGMMKIFRSYYASLVIQSYFARALKQISEQVNKNSINCYCYTNTIEKDPELYKAIKSDFSKVNIYLSEFTEHTEPINIDSIARDSYYRDFFKILNIILSHTKINKIYLEFEENCKTLKNEFDTSSPLYIPKRVFNFKNLQHIKLYLITLTIIISSLILLLFNLVGEEESKVIEELEKFLSSSNSKEFSANNISQTQASKNHSLIKIVEKTIVPKNQEAIELYFNREDVPSDVLMKYLHTIQALSAYYLYNQHDGQKARNLLLSSKKLAENYVNKRSKVVIDFDNLSSKELFAELRIVEHLPQLYTRLLYLLGRSFFYNTDHSELETGKKYFKTTKELSSILGLFEYYMSQLNGIVQIELQQQEFLLKNNKLSQNEIEEVKLKLLELVATYQILKADNTTYIFDYNPKTDTQLIKTPAKDLFNVLICESSMIKIYKMLMEIDHNNEITNYIDNIISILNKGANIPGLLQIIENIDYRKKAVLYNELANILIILYDKKHEDQKLRSFIENALHVRSKNNLHLAEQLFEQAKITSREIDYTKSDALGGLVIVYKKYLSDGVVQISEKEMLNKKVIEYSKKRDLINKTLGRKI